MVNRWFIVGYSWLIVAKLSFIILLDLILITDITKEVLCFDLAFFRIFHIVILCEIRRTPSTLKLYRFYRLHCFHPTNYLYYSYHSILILYKITRATIFKAPNPR